VLASVETLAFAVSVAPESSVRRRQEQERATPASAFRMIHGGIEAVTAGGIVIGSFYNQKSNRHQRTENAKPEKQRNGGTGMADRSREETFIQLKFTAGVEFAHRESDVTAGFPVEVFYFCWVLFVFAVLECSCALCACCWAWVACSLPLA
jgi:hypothetical protein